MVNIKYNSEVNFIGSWVNTDTAFIAAASYTDGKMTDIKVGNQVTADLVGYTLYLLDSVNGTYAPLCASRPLN